MSRPTSKDHFKRVWDEHIQDFSRLLWSLDKEEDHKELTLIQLKLKVLVRKAAKGLDLPEHDPA